jgi:hypothetical protein
MSLQAIISDAAGVRVLDQLLLPATSKYVDVTKAQDAWACIREMKVPHRVRTPLCLSHPKLTDFARCAALQPSQSWLLFRLLLSWQARALRLQVTSRGTF